MRVPMLIRNLNERPGIDWTPREVERVARWWLAEEQMSVVLQYATLYLGNGATPQDIEDAAAAFYELLEPTRRSYQPGKLCFSDYLLKICFKNYCVKTGNRIRERIARELSLDCIAPSGTILELGLGSASEAERPYRFTRGRAMLAEVNRWLNTPELPQSLRAVFTLRYFYEMTYEEIAHALKCPMGSVKGWLYRANAEAAKHLRKRGWSDETQAN